MLSTCISASQQRIRNDCESCLDSMTGHLTTAILSATLSVLCVSCAATPPVSPASDVPSTFDNASVRESAVWPAADWYRSFGSAELDTLIAEATAGNLDIAAAQARVRQADARLRAAGAESVPQVDVGGNAAHFRGRTDNASAHETDWSALLSASYEVDFWGKHRAVSDSARMTERASQADRETVALTALSGVASAYFQVLSLRARERIAHENLDAAKFVVSGIEARVREGAATESELASQRALVANVELTIAPLAQAQSEALGALAILLGRAPEGFAVSEQSLVGVNEPTFAPGLPAELLLRRPDVQRAEANLLAAHADVAVARAALFPSLLLTASTGAQNPAMQAAVLTLEGTGVSFTAGAALVQTIFDGGRRRAVRDEASAKEEELLAGYRAAILSALLDVEDSLGAVAHLRAQEAAQAANVEESERAYEGARLRYGEGSGDFLTVFEAQRTLYAARDQMSQFRLARLMALVSLSKALGGGWQASQIEVAR
jgi:outer membrane protein, multidrug efflux system